MVNFQTITGFLFLIGTAAVYGAPTPASSEPATEIYEGVNWDVLLTDKSTECKESIKKIDALAKAVMLMDGNKNIPRNETLRTEWCNPLKDLPKIVKVYSRCAPKFIATILKVVVSGLKKPIKYICKSPLERSLKHFLCIDDEYLVKILSLESKLVDAVNTLNNRTVSRDIVLPGICCTMHVMLEQLLKLDHKPCADPTANPNKFIKDRIDGVIGQVLDLVCGNYPNAASCNDNNKEIVDLVTSEWKGPRDLRNVPFMPSLLQVVASLAEDDSVVSSVGE